MDNQVKVPEKKLEEQQRKSDEQAKKFDELMQLMSELNSSGENRSDSPRFGGNRQLGYVPKVEFPKFDGSNTRNWIKKCSRYFDLCKIPNNQKVDLASLNMIDKAEHWMGSYMAVRNQVDWDGFVIDVISRFMEEKGSNVVELFNKLQQDDSLENYIDEFENLRAVMRQESHVLPDKFILESFIGGLKPAVKPLVKAFKPTSMTEAVEYARLQEETLSHITLNSLQYNLDSNPFYHSDPKHTLVATAQSIQHPKPLPATPNKTNPIPLNTFNQRNSKKNLKHIPADVRTEKIAKGLCYFCDNLFQRGHKCDFKETQLLFTVEVHGNVIDCAQEDMDVLEEEIGEPVISVNAMIGNQDFQTMRVVGRANNKPFHVLVDSGSTHNFLDLNVAKKLGCEMKHIPVKSVTVADGTHLACQYACEAFQWEMQGRKFSAAVMLIPLGNCDMVLGIQWLSTLGTVVWNFSDMSMEICLGQDKFLLKGVTSKRLKVIQGETSNKLLENPVQCCLLQTGGKGCSVRAQLDQKQTVGEEFRKLRFELQGCSYLGGCCSVEKNHPEFLTL